MNSFIGFTKKEFLHILRDARTLVILFGLPIAQLLIFGFVVTNEIQDARIAIIDNSHDQLTLEITNKILSSGYFILEENLNNSKQIEKKFKEGNIREVIIFEPEFEARLSRDGSASIQIITDASDPNTANIVSSYTKGIILDYAIKELNTGYKINIAPRMLYNEDLKGAFFFVPGTMAFILMLVSAMMTSIAIAREKEIGTMEVLLASPLKPIQIIIGKVTPYVFLSFINAVSIILLGFFVFGLPINGSLLLLLSESILFIILSLSLGILISTISKNQQMAMFISMFALMLPTMLLSGFIYPVKNMPVLLQLLSHIVPAKYFIIIIKDIMIKGTGLLFIWKETLILVLFTIVFIGLSVKNFKIRLE